MRERLAAVLKLKRAEAEQFRLKALKDVLRIEGRLMTLPAEAKDIDPSPACPSDSLPTHIDRPKALV
jgi:hypothetical protein